MSRDISDIAPSLPIFIASLSKIPWFKNVGKPHARDHDVVRIGNWEEWHGPEQGYGDWFGRFPSIVRERLRANHIDRVSELDAVDAAIAPMVRALAIKNVPEYRPEWDPWYGPWDRVWQAGGRAALMGGHILLGQRLPDCGSMGMADRWTLAM